MARQSRQLGKVLRRARLEAGLTQREIALALGLGVAFANQIENGRRPLPIACIPRLPDAIRGAVIDAAISEHQNAIDALEAMR